MFRMRHRVLVDKKGWEEIRKPDGIECDEFDRDDAIYLIATDFNGSVAGCVRFTPSLSPNLTSEHFLQLCDLEVPPRGEGIYDASRLVVEHNLQKRARASVIASELICGCIEAGIAMGLDEFTAVMNVPYVTLSLSMGWDIRPLGTPQQVGDEAVIAVKVKTNEKQLAQARQSRKYPKRVLSDADAELVRVTHRILHQTPDRRAA